MWGNNKNPLTLFKGVAAIAFALLLSACGEDANESYGDATIGSTVTGDYTLVVEQCQIHWIGRKVTGSHEGNVGVSEGFLTFKDSMLVGGEIVVDMTSIDSDDEDLTEHLLDTDFFSTEEWPTAKFVIKEGKEVNGNYVVTGDLTIMNYTNTIDFKVNITADSENVTGSTTFTFDRVKWGVHYNSASVLSDVGDNFILDDVELQITLVAKK